MTTDNHESAKVAIVTGAGHPDGIGAASAEALRNQAYEVVTFDLEGADHAVDVTDAQQVAKAIQAAMTAIINPLGVPSTALPSVEEITDPNTNNSVPSVGGSYYLCINPAKFGSIDAVKAGSDAYVDAIQNCPPRPNQSARVPGSVGYQRLIENAAEVDVLTNHWDPFFVGIAGKYGLTEGQLRQSYSEQKVR